MDELKWSHREKQIAREVFERAAVAEEAELLDRFKARVASLKTMSELWALQSALRQAENDYQKKYDYRYSQLIVVFGRLLREGRISRDMLDGLSEEKLRLVERIASL